MNENSRGKSKERDKEGEEEKNKERGKQNKKTHCTKEQQNGGKKKNNLERAGQNREWKLEGAEEGRDKERGTNRHRAKKAPEWRETEWRETITKEDREKRQGEMLVTYSTVQSMWHAMAYFNLHTHSDITNLYCFVHNITPSGEALDKSSGSYKSPGHLEKEKKVREEKTKQ